MSIFDALALKGKSLRYKILIAFSLMSILPLLIVVYFAVEYAFTGEENLLYPSVVVLTTAWLSLLGFILIQRVISPVIRLAPEARAIADGRFDSEVTVKGEGEVGNIVDAVSVMRDKLHGNEAELQKYDRTTAALNQQVSKKAGTLNNLMQLSGLSATGAKPDEILCFAAEKLTCELEDSFSGIFIKDEKGEFSSKWFVNNSGKEISIHEILDILPFAEQVFNKGDRRIILDSGPLTKRWQTDFRKKLELVNLIIEPMRYGGEILGMIMLGNFAAGHKFKDEDVRPIEAFEKITVIGYQASHLDEAGTGGSIDSLTGLYSRSSLEKVLEDEINRAVFYHRACSLVVLGIDGFEDYSERYGESKAEQVLKQVGKLIRGEIAPVVKAARFGFSEFGIILPEKNKRESIEIAERIRAQIETMQISDDPGDRVTMSAGIGENPLDGVRGEDIIAKAVQNLSEAVEQGKNRVVG